MPPRRSAHREDPTFSPSGPRYSLDPESPVRRSSRLGSEGFTPIKEFSLRAQTPDARQLHDTLRAASESPTKARPGSRLDNSTHSSATPSPPVQRTISTTSTPNAPSLNPAIATTESSPLEQTDRGFSFFRYPRLSNIVGFGNHNRDSSVLSSRQHDDTFDNESVISWRIERELHRDDIQRKQREEFNTEELQEEEEDEEFAAETSQGQTIRAPPRRLSGLVWPNDATNTPERPESPKVRSAAARTIISAKVEPDESDESRESSVKPAGREGKAPLVDMPRAPPKSTQKKESRGQIPWSLVAIAMLIPVATIAVYFFSDKLTPSSNPFARRSATYAPLNETENRIISQLTGEVDRLEVQLSSMSRDVHRLGSEQRRVVEQITAVQPVSETIAKINFLSLGLGARVDSMLTSPSIGIRRTFMRRVSENIFGSKLPRPNPPEIALQPWEDVGDCWCAAPGKNGQAQLGVQLGQRAVLDEVVVEHIPFGASPRPDLAPREMELWVRFKPHHGKPGAPSTTETPITSTSGKTGWFGRTSSSQSSSPASSQTPSPPLSLSSLLKMIMTTLRNAYPGEPESAYSDDRLLGPSFFRVGKWEYDQTAESVQHFALDAVVDVPMLRVDKAVVRVNSNWGGNHTCLYRVKLHGHLKCLIDDLSGDFEVSDTTDTSTAAIIFIHAVLTAQCLLFSVRAEQRLSMARNAQPAKTQPQTQTQISSSSSSNQKAKPRQKQKQKHTITLPRNGVIALPATNLLSRVASPPLGVDDGVVTLTDAHATYIMHISDYGRVDAGLAHLEGVLQQSFHCYYHHPQNLGYGAAVKGGQVTVFTNRETLKERVGEQLCKRRKGSLLFSLFSGGAPVRWSRWSPMEGDAEAEADACDGAWLEIDSAGDWHRPKRVQMQVQVQYVQHTAGYNVVDAGVVDVWAEHEL
ncbi:hypothetical protein PISL3812_01211 [Talaromyces islandicus]|uniref:SUN domain-containing protein n=1 Tax=Talaromyces islandicus TaxID=28573 RepID=A0A0U1LLM9_TALIS|nr:hypothetical protein PISL3812_01211 [Talaromyces islandicus]